MLFIESVNMSAVDFESISIADIERHVVSGIDELPFGVIGFDNATLVEVYNATEAQMAGLDAQRIFGKPFFDVIAPCMNNYLVAQRFEDEPELDVIIPYVLTLRMRPTHVRLHLLSAPHIARRYILIQR
jgi:photoactive yellow protein